MKKLENILENIEEIQNWIMKIDYGNENLTAFWQWKIDLQNKYNHLGQISYVLLFFGFPLFILIILISIGFLIRLYTFIKESAFFYIFFAWLVCVWMPYWFLYLPYKMFTCSPINDANKIQKLQDFIKYIHNTPEVLYQANEDFKDLLQSKNNNALIISERVLKYIEKISENQKKIQKYFKIDYIQKVEKIIFEEIQLLQKILEYSFENQISHHKKAISEIENLQNIEWKDFSVILELQKIRLENQKNIFEKFAQK